MKPRDVVKLRESLGLKQSEFAEALGVSQSLVSRWESGEVPVRLPMVRLIERTSFQAPSPAA